MRLTRSAWLAIAALIALLCAAGWGFAIIGGGGGDLAGGIAALQGMLHRDLAIAIRGVAADGADGAAGGWAAAGFLIGLSFAYGVFHALGPGHGKAVVASYILSGRTGATGAVTLALLGALAQGGVAVAVVGVLRIVLWAGRGAIDQTLLATERVSAVILIGLGLWMVWRVLRRRSACGHDHHHGDEGCHSHGAQIPAGATIEAADQAGGGRVWRAVAGPVAAIGLRPCSGAILVLLFASAQAMFGIGVIAVAAMSIGTALTTAGVALATLAGRGGLLTATDRLSTGGGVVLRQALGLASAGLIATLGAALLVGTFARPAAPF